MRGRFVDEDPTAVLLERVGVGVGLQQSGAVTEVAVGVAQRREHEMKLLAVVGTLSQRRAGLDERHLSVGVLTTVGGGAELVGEEPQRGVVTAGHDTGVPAGSGWDCDAALR